MKKFLSLLLCSAICIGMLCGCHFNISKTMAENAAEFAEGRDIGEPVLLGVDEAVLEKIDQFSGSLYVPKITVTSEYVQSNPDIPIVTVSNDEEMIQALSEICRNLWEEVKINFKDNYLAPLTKAEKNQYLYDLHDQLRRADPLNASNLYTMKLAQDGLTITYYCDSNTAKERNEDVEAKVEEIANEIRLDADTKYEMVLEVNRYLCEHVEYPAEEDKPYKQYTHTPYGALIEGIAVCDGYATAAMLILRKLDIPCDLQLGWATKLSNKNPSDDDLHAWNLVYLNNYWYQLDVTWNDEIGAFYDYFLVADSYMLRTHKWKPCQYRETPWLRFHP